MRLGEMSIWGMTMLLATACNAPPAPPITAAENPTVLLNVGGSEIHVHVTGDPSPLPQQAIDAWVNTAAQALTSYFGRFPVKRLDLSIAYGGEEKLSGGTTYEGRRITIRIGSKTRPADLAGDWMLTHEMFHLAFPDLDKKHLWMNEGLSTYLEPIARTRNGNMTVDQFWREMIEGMPQGLPEPGDHGLDQTHTWGRTYWGGAMFWLLADVRIREQTQNRKSLDDAIRAILKAGGDGSVIWPISRVIEVGDKATDTSVLKDLYEQMGDHAVSPDLAALWKRLGVRLQRGRVTFDERALLAEIRKALVQKKS